MAIDAKRRALGKGLDSLLPRMAPPATPAEEPEKSRSQEGEKGAALEIPLTSIDRNPFQTRTIFDEKLLEELAQSIRANGVVQPIMVRPGKNGRYQLITGERRWLASQKAGKETIPAVLRAVGDHQALEITIIENLQRADLNPIEQARAFERLSREFAMTQEQMAFRTGKDRASIGNYIRMLKLPESVQIKVANGTLSHSHAKVLLALDHPEEIEEAVSKILALSLNVRQAETFIHNMMFPDRAVQKEEGEVKRVDPNVKEAQERMQRALGMRVRIEDRNGRGRVIIEYGRLEDFDALMDQICGI